MTGYIFWNHQMSTSSLDIRLLEQLPTEILVSILFNLSSDEVLSFCRSSSEFRKGSRLDSICRDGYIWSQIARRDFGVTPSEFHRIDIQPPSERYISLKTFFWSYPECVSDRPPYSCLAKSSTNPDLALYFLRRLRAIKDPTLGQYVDNTIAKLITAGRPDILLRLVEEGFVKPQQAVSLAIGNPDLLRELFDRGLIDERNHGLITHLIADAIDEQYPETVRFLIDRFPNLIQMHHMVDPVSSGNIEILDMLFNYIYGGRDLEHLGMRLGGALHGFVQVALMENNQPVLDYFRSRGVPLRFFQSNEPTIY